VDIPTIRTALKAAVNTIPQLHADDLRDSPNVPCAIILPDAPFDFDLTLDGAVWPKFLVTLLVAYTDTGSAQAEMDRYLSSDGPSSVKTALEQDRTLGGAVSSCSVTELRSYGVIQLRDGGVRYLAAELVVEVYA
jgi:hypothetical protein